MEAFVGQEDAHWHIHVEGRKLAAERLFALKFIVFQGRNPAVGYVGEAVLLTISTSQSTHNLICAVAHTLATA